jgi:hypothetical protein
VTVYFIKLSLGNYCVTRYSLDVDECSVNETLCSDNQYCSNSEGSYACLGELNHDYNFRGICVIKSNFVAQMLSP